MVAQVIYLHAGLEPNSLPSSLDFRKRYLMSCGAGALINLKEVSTI
jgi:hypothetical protein